MTVRKKRKKYHDKVLKFCYRGDKREMTVFASVCEGRWEYHDRGPKCLLQKTKIGIYNERISKCLWQRKKRDMTQF